MLNIKTILGSVIVAAVLVGAYFQLRPDKEVMPLSTTTSNVSSSTKIAMFGGGCFWCVESDLEKVDGVIRATSGYAGGKGENPTYENYSAGGFREVVQVVYDPSRLSFANLVENVIKHGDPTDPDGSFYDRGQQYAPAIYYTSDEEKKAAEIVVRKINDTKVYEKPLTIVIIPDAPFFAAEEYHQDYYKKNPLRYGYYRGGSGRDAFIKKYWGDNAGQFTASDTITINTMNTTHVWESYKKPSDAEIKQKISAMQYQVTQKEGTERPFNNEYDTNKAEGIYVDILSGEPLYVSKDKFDSGTGWPSFVKPVTSDAVVLKEDRGIFGSRTEVRSRYSDSHLGHVFDDGPIDRGGKRYCMNSAALRFIPKDQMEKEGYGEYISSL